jgi:hypothetical protein
MPRDSGQRPVGLGGANPAADAQDAQAFLF